MKRDCLMCNQPMKLEKKFESKPCKTQSGKYRVRRFTCTFCDYSELVLASGGAEEIRKEGDLKAVDRMYKEQSNNQI